MRTATDSILRQIEARGYTVAVVDGARGVEMQAVHCETRETFSAWANTGQKDQAAHSLAQFMEIELGNSEIPVLAEAE